VPVDEQQAKVAAYPQMTLSGTSRPGWNQEGWARHHRRPTQAGKQATPGSVDRGTGLAGVRGEG
jgi:hypothetical protein